VLAFGRSVCSSSSSSSCSTLGWGLQQHRHLGWRGSTATVITAAAPQSS
jgi:hypothetical protein